MDGSLSQNPRSGLHNYWQASASSRCRTNAYAMYGQSKSRQLPLHIERELAAWVFHRRRLNGFT